MIDTAAKRRMAAAFKPIHKAPLPDGTISKQDRVHAGWTYGGVFMVLDLEDVLKRVSPWHNLGKAKPSPYDMGVSQGEYTLGG